MSTPGYDGPEGTEWPRQEKQHKFCPIDEPHPKHGMALYGYSGQTCGGLWKGDPTYGRIDRDIQFQVEEMKPENLGQRVALENTLQNKRNREK